MRSDSCGKLVPADENEAKIFFDALVALADNQNFKTLLKFVSARLSVVMDTNLIRGQENAYTEGQAWKWLLNSASAAKASVPEKVIG